MPCVVGLWSLVGGTVLLSTATPPLRAHGSPSPASIAAALVTVPSAAPAYVGISLPLAISAPPAGEGTYRPSHFTVASVIVTFQRTRFVGLSRLGGLYGP